LRQLLADSPSLVMSWAVAQVAWEQLRREAGLPVQTRLSSVRFRELLVNLELYDRWFLGSLGERRGPAGLALLDLIEACHANGWKPLALESRHGWLTAMAADPKARSPRRLRHYRTTAQLPWLADVLERQGQPVMSLAHLSCRLGQLARRFRAEAREAEGRGPRKGRRQGTKRAQARRRRRGSAT
jgi:hypothetical protein